MEEVDDDDLLDEVEVLEALVELELDVLLVLVELLAAVLPEQLKTVGPVKLMPLSRLFIAKNSDTYQG